MKILGLNHDMFISSAALIEDGRIVAAAPEERFTRVKRTRDFPINAVRFCLREANCSIEDVDYVVSSWNPGVYWKKFNPLFSGRRRWKTEYLFSIPDYILTLYPEQDRDVDYVFQRIQLLGRECKIYYITHHRAHAANAFFLSPFEEAAILTADAQGEFESTTFGYGKGNRITVYQAILYPQSLGAFYSTFTEYLGFRPNSDEWKVMALAAFADWENVYYRILRDEVVKLLPEGRYEFDLTFFNGYNAEQPNLYTDKLVARFGPPRLPGEELEPRHYEIAAAMQRVAEEVAFHMLHWLYQHTRCKNLVVSGGFFMNSVLNGKILSHTPFERLFISSCPDDSGNAIGAALYLYNHILGHPEREPLRHNFFGPEYDEAAIQGVLEKYNVHAERVDDIAAYSARLISEGRLVGWFQGRMEFGQRALGNRSILADPRDPRTKDKVNLAVKYREPFRPFARAVLEEEAQAYFELDEGVTVPFMEKVYPIRPDKREVIPAVTHVDGSGRLQTVDRETNPRFYRLIEEFRAITGVPVVLNTSFNLNGEPIVCSPTDAIRTFFSCGLDVLVLGDYVVWKNGKGR